MVALKGVQFIANNIKKNDEDIEVFLDVKNMRKPRFKYSKVKRSARAVQKQCNNSTITGHEQCKNSSNESEIIGKKRFKGSRQFKVSCCLIGL